MQVERLTGDTEAWSIPTAHLRGRVSSASQGSMLESLSRFLDGVHGIWHLENSHADLVHRPVGFLFF